MYEKDFPMFLNAINIIIEMQCYVIHVTIISDFSHIRVLRVRGGLPEEEERQERGSPVPRFVLQKAKDYD